MNTSNYRLTFDIHSAQSQHTVRVKKGDTARKIYALFTDGGRPYTLTEECTAAFRAVTPAGNNIFNECFILDGVLEHELTVNTTADVGEVSCEFMLFGADNRQITAPKFTVLVEETVNDETDITQTDEFTALTHMMSNAETVITNTGVACELANSAAESARTAAEFTNSVGLEIQKKLENGELKGDTGPQGEKGEAGPQGEQGPVAPPIVFITTFQVIALAFHKILFFEGDAVYNLTQTTDEHIVYIMLGSDLTFNGWAKPLALSNDNSLSQNFMTYFAPTGIWSNVSAINDGRVIPAGQALILHVKGSGTAGIFEFVHLLNLPAPVTT